MIEERSFDSMTSRIREEDVRLGGKGEEQLKLAVALTFAKMRGLKWEGM